MINVDAAKIAYKANDTNVKIYLEADSDVNKSSREFDRVSWRFKRLRLITHEIVQFNLDLITLRSALFAEEIIFANWLFFC